MIVSADDYFMRDGTFHFDVNKIGEAHASCLRRFLDFVHPDDETPPGLSLRVAILRGLPGSGKSTWARRHERLFDVCVDNTNTSVAEIAPYAASALAFGHRVRILTIRSRPEFAAARNIHGVPPITVGMMYQRMVTEVLPPWWTSLTINDDEIDLPMSESFLFPKD